MYTRVREETGDTFALEYGDAGEATSAGDSGGASSSALSGATTGGAV